jgi:hypothetical protein
MSMLFVDRSVGANISDGLTCLSYESDEAAPNSCKRYAHVVSQFSSPPGEVNWFKPGGYNRVNWTYNGWPGSGIPPELPCGVSTGLWFSKLECFVRYVDANPQRYRVVSYQNSYLEVENSSDIASPSTGYFARQANRYDIGDFEALEGRHPGTIFLHHTTSLARGIGNQVATDFNNQMREYVRANNKFMLDVADIESHDPSGNPCYDNRDGVPYTAGNASENYPNDGVQRPAICQHYTRESDGGHLGNPDPGKIRLAKAFWILMARVAGWNPGGSEPPPPPPPPPPSGSGYALRFDGRSDFVRLHQTADMMAASWPTTKTVELWIKPTGSPFCSAPNPMTCDAIIGDNPRRWGISRGIINGLDRIWVWNWAGAATMISFPYTPNEWTHIAMVHGGGMLSAYKNGALMGQVASGATQDGLTGLVQFGGIIHSSTRNFTFGGDIDDVRFWNTARTAQQIVATMNSTLTGSETGLAAYYRMSNGSGTSLTDDSGHALTGSLQDGGGGVPADGPILWVAP